MRWFRRILTAVVVLMVALTVIIFVLENQSDVNLSFLGWRTPEGPLSLFVSLAFVLGGLGGVLSGMLLRLIGSVSKGYLPVRSEAMK
ncbi:lipopolysaccharide assembly protein LapA domain-containing protein [Pseudomonas aeruginosa]|uniref:lipopolysaccharide assembly protein LapA domain-containing protein n=1 Tax=Pseudomonas aeruginosa TaxID=287 RepID=UPI0005A6D31D|nr:lipopolysaccharide assembly protein LapA domain-containing protein [Pseudomonas aeruginosa]MBI9183725.1 DUF1049 domain-containing protein [Pseudomonas aeruginosa]MBY9794924.1 DUF1049 domain-containing protein [Pseudomonas aeruginosa]MCT5309353.1 lipopolysaccharide assembly protein LapA domain-containing protein [Pseudomonas aeruginosa]MCW4646420.1 lipopolysaccharide assembly protein LapA domain-containing protein [Pseudomonas aeruginosa]MDD1833648.1 lipopolysaccharide assembly protein LapA 